MNFLNRLLSLLAECEMAEKDWRIETEGVHIFRCSGIDFASAGEDGTLGFCLRGSVDVWDTHEFKEFLAIIIVFPGNADRTPGKLLNLFSSAGLLGFFVSLFSFGFALKSLC